MFQVWFCTGMSLRNYIEFGGRQAHFQVFLLASHWSCWCCLSTGSLDPLNYPIRLSEAGWCPTKVGWCPSSGYQYESPCLLYYHWNRRKAWLSSRSDNQFGIHQVAKFVISKLHKTPKLAYTITLNRAICLGARNAQFRARAGSSVWFKASNARFARLRPLFWLGLDQQLVLFGYWRGQWYGLEDLGAGLTVFQKHFFRYEAVATSITFSRDACRLCTNRDWTASSALSS